MVVDIELIVSSEQFITANTPLSHWKIAADYISSFLFRVATAQ